MTDLPFSLMQNPPEEGDALSSLRKEIFMALNSHHVGVIRSFDAATQTASIDIVYKRAAFTQESIGVITQELIPYPTLNDVPVMFLGGGPVSLEFPVDVGDECILLFIDRDIDNWYVNGDIGNGCDTLRMHSISDAIALVGLRNATKALPDFTQNRARMRYVDGEGNTISEVFVGSSSAGFTHYHGSGFSDQTKLWAGEKVTFENEVTDLRTELVRLIEALDLLNVYLGGTGQLIDAITQITVPVAGITAGGASVVSGVPANAAAISSFKSDITDINNELDDIKAKLGGLLS